MSGWIKIEKDLLTDPRFTRMAKRACKTCNAGVTQVRCDHHDAVTQVLGSLARLWIYADSHIREDDTLDFGADEIDEVVGFKGFAQLMPTDWLEIINADSVKLTDFQAHNGTDAKKKALTAKRVARHRIRSVTHERNDVSEGSNAPALPDQTRPDQTRPTLPEGARSVKPTATVHRLGPTPHVTEDEIFEAEIRSGYPEFSGRHDWLTPFHHCRLIVERQEATRSHLIAAVHRYATYVASGGVSGPKYVLPPTTFFSAVDKPWSQAWDPPPKPQSETDMRLARDAAELQALMEGRAARGLLDFRDPYQFEGPGAYATSLRLEEQERRATPKGETATVVASLADGMRVTG